jgi:protein-S-isoprenylcysteine O-methyltransferase Ste14
MKIFREETRLREKSPGYAADQWRVRKLIPFVS